MGIRLYIWFCTLFLAGMFIANTSHTPSPQLAGIVMESVGGVGSVVGMVMKGKGE